MKKSFLLSLMSLWPPYLGAGIRVKNISPDFRSMEVEMKLRFWNQNYVGTQFGGSLYSMVDPFFMLILMENLGPEYLVWDKSATIRFKKPGKGRVRALFKIEQSEIDAIRDQAASGQKVEPGFQVMIRDDSGEVVAEVDKQLWIRRKDSSRGPNAGQGGEMR